MLTGVFVQIVDWSTHFVGANLLTVGESAGVDVTDVAVEAEHGFIYGFKKIFWITQMKMRSLKIV